MTRLQRYRIRFTGDVRPRGWRLVEGKIYLLRHVTEDPPYYLPTDSSWPNGAPARIAEADAEPATKRLS